MLVLNRILKIVMIQGSNDKVKNMKKKNKVIAGLLFVIFIINISLINVNGKSNLTLKNLHSFAFAQVSGEVCLDAKTAICKNRPSLDNGYCIIEPGKACCKESSVFNHDCYGVTSNM